MLNNSFNSFLFYINHFEMIDYIAFTWFIVLSFLFLLLGILLLRKYTIMAIVIIFTVLIIFSAGPFAIKWYINNAIRAVKTQIISKKQLNFSDTFIIEGKIINQSKRDFSTCKVYVGFYKTSKNKYKQFLYNLKPYQKYIKNIQKNIQKSQSADFTIVLNDTKINPDVNITAATECYK